MSEARESAALALVWRLEDAVQALKDAEEEFPGMGEEVWNRLRDRATARQPELQDSIHQMLSGLATRVREPGSAASG